MTNDEKRIDLMEKVADAHRWEKRSNICRYVRWSVPDNQFIVTERMPLMGEWYDSAGVRHG